MNRLTLDKRVQIINALVEGNSLRAAARLSGVAFNTVLKLLPEIGKACEEYQRRVLVNLPCKRVQCDEIWSFCYAKQKNVPADKEGQFGYGWAIALYFMHYNFCRVHQTLRVTPAMEAGISDHVWGIEELVSLLERSVRIAA